MPPRVFSAAERRRKDRLSSTAKFRTFRDTFVALCFLGFVAVSVLQGQNLCSVYDDLEIKPQTSSPPPVTIVKPFGERDIDPVLVKSFAKVKNPGSWDLDPESFLQKQQSAYGFKCNWLDFVSTSGNTAQMCCHDNTDLITGAITQNKRWPDCDILSRLWNESTDKTPNSVYLEIGANIGSCVMEMLLSTDAKIIAFEPHPKNGFNLQKTIQNLDPSYQKRVVLVPVGLGKESGANTIFASKRNMGNSVVGKVIKDYSAEKDSDFVEYDIYVEPLLSILDATSGIDIPLIKMDAQGFECQILDGISPALAKLIRKIKLEIASEWLRQQNCFDLFQKFDNLGFVLRREGQSKPLKNLDRPGVWEVIATNEKQS